EQHRLPDEGIYVVGKDGPLEFLWYWRGHPGPVIVKQSDDDAIPWRRFWVVGAYQPQKGIASIEPDLQRIASSARELQRFAGNGGAAVLFEKRNADLTPN